MNQPLIGQTADMCAIGQEGNRVVMKFHQPVDWIAWNPDVALQIGMTMAKIAYRIEYGIEQPGAKIISEQTRQKLVTRCAHIIRSMSEKNHKHGVIAMACVDAVLQEAT